MANQTPVRDFDKMMLRLPPGMRERIAEAAKASGRSANTEVIARLEASFEMDLIAMARSQMIDQHEELIGDHAERIRELERDVARLLDKVGILYDRGD